MESRKSSIVPWFFAIDFLLVLSGLILIICAKTALVGYALLFAGIVLAGIAVAVFVLPPSPHHKVEIIDPREGKRHT